MLLRDMFDDFARTVKSESGSELVFHYPAGHNLRHAIHAPENIPHAPVYQHIDWHAPLHVKSPTFHRHHDTWRGVNQSHNRS